MIKRLRSIPKRYLVYFSRPLYRWRMGLAVLLMLMGIMGAEAGHLSAWPLQQGGVGRLNFGDSSEGEISAEQYRVLYLFDGQGGQVISLTMTRTDGNLDPYLVLVDSNGVVLASSDDDGTTRNAQIASYRLSSNGTYTVIATRFGHEHGSTIGNYRLELQSLGRVTTSDTSNIIPYGAAVPGELDNAKSEDIYIFQAQRGDVIHIYMRRTSGNLDPLLDLYLDPLGQPLRSEDDDGSTQNAAITNYLIPQDGTYYIRATRYGRSGGSSSGTYLLSLEAVPPDTLGTRLSNARYLNYGSTLTGTISDEISARYFQFEAQRGDIVSVFVARSSANDDLVPTISLLSLELNQIAASTNTDTQREARLAGVSIPETGLYYLVISRLEGLNGDTTGAFELELMGRPGLVNSTGLEIVYGGQVNGILDQNNFADTYIFVGQANDVITITMRRSEGDLDTLLTLRNADGKQLAANDDGFDDGSRDSIIRAFVLPADGIYQIEASRYDRTVGTTSGMYILRLDLETEN